MVKKASQKVGIIIQARRSSKRLADKVLLPLPQNSKTTVIEQIIRRAKKVKGVSCIILATTKKKTDDALVKVASKTKISSFRGSESNVLSRFYLAAKQNKLDHIIRLTGDNPCIDPSLVEATLKKHLKGKTGFTATKFYPIGMNVEIMSVDTLEKVFKNTKDQSDKEHVTSYIYKNPKQFKVSLSCPSNKSKTAQLRVSLDSREDYALLCAIYEFLYSKKPLFGLKDLLNLFAKKPWLKIINANIVQKGMLKTKKQEYKEAVEVLKLQGLSSAQRLVQKHIRQK